MNPIIADQPEDIIEDDRTSRLARPAAVIAAAALGLAVPATLVGCNTAEGLGDDMEAVGENLSDEAEDASD